MSKIITISVLFLAGLIFIIIAKKQQAIKKNHNNFISSTPVSLPYSFKTEKAEQLSIEAYNLNRAKQYTKAIELYRTAIKIEPKNPRLWFDLSDCYSGSKNLKQAVLVLDTAILLDSSCAAFYNNRGLYYYNLNEDQNAINDLHRAIILDSSNWITYANLALAYYSKDNFQEACKALNASKRLGLDWSELNSQVNLERIDKICK